MRGYRPEGWDDILESLMAELAESPVTTVWGPKDWGEELVDLFLELMRKQKGVPARVVNRRVEIRRSAIEVAGRRQYEPTPIGYTEGQQGEYYEGPGVLVFIPDDPPELYVPPEKKKGR